MGYMSTTKGKLDGYLDAYDSAIDSSDWDAAEKALAKAEARLQSLPNTEQASWRGTLDRAWDMLGRLRDRAQDTTGTLIHAALRRKTRSTRSDGT